MPNWIFLTTVFGFFLAQEKSGRLNLFARHNNLKLFLSESVRLIWQPLLLVALYSGAERGLPGRQSAEWAIPFLLLGAFWLGRLERRSAVFFLGTFTIAYFAIAAPEADLFARLVCGGGLALSILLFQTLLLGVAERLALCDVPASLEGLPVLMIAGALVSLALWGFWACPSV